MKTGLSLQREQTVLLVVDIQERLCAAMLPDRLERMVKEVRTLIRGADILGIPVIVSEQYPKGLGPTIPAVTEVLPRDVTRLEKRSFSCMEDDGLSTRITSLSAGKPGDVDDGRDQWIICGMEAHVCMFQTVRDMVTRLGVDVFVPSDAVLSRTGVNLDVGLSLMARAGAVVTSVESVLFDLLGRAGTSEFKAISALVK